MGEETKQLTAVKLLAFIGMLYLGFDAISYFYAASTDAMMILWGIIELIFAIVIFLGLAYWDLIPFNLPFNWMILLIIGVVTIIFGFFAGEGSWFSGAIVTMAALIDLFAEKRGWKASKMVALLGAALGIYDSIIIFMGLQYFVAPANTPLILNAVFGLILAIILIIIIFNFVDIKIPYEWWVLLIIGFVFFSWVAVSAALSGVALILAGTTVVIVGWSGWILLIAFLLLILGF